MMFKTPQTATRDFHAVSTALVPRGDIVGLAREWYRRVVSRHQLAELDARLLRDIGLDQEAARAEVRKPFWQA